MAIFDLFKKKSNDNDFEKFIELCDKKMNYYRLADAQETIILGWSDYKKIECLIYIINNFGHFKSTGDYGINTKQVVCGNIVSLILAEKLQYGDETFLVLTTLNQGIDKLQGDINSHNNYYFNSIYLTLIKHLIKYSDKVNQDIINQLKSLLNNLVKMISVFPNYSKEITTVVKKLETHLFDVDPELKNVVKKELFVEADEFANFANLSIEDKPEDERVIWYKLMSISQKSTGSKPTKKFMDEAKVLIEQIGTDKFKKTSREWFLFIINLKETTFNEAHGYLEFTFLNAFNSDIIKGFIWMSSLFYDNETIQTITQLAERCYKKIPGRGPTAGGLGNACLYTLYASKGLDGIAQLSRLKQKIKQNNTLNLIETYIEKAAEKLGITASEVEDLAVDDFKLMEYKRLFEFDQFTCELTLSGIGKSNLKWFKENGEEQKTVPAVVKENFALRYKKVKEVQKQIDQTTSAQKERMDKMLRSERKMASNYFKEKYLAHGLISFVIANVIFTFSNANKKVVVIKHEGKWTDPYGGVFELEEFDYVSFWHPVQSSTDEVRQWRTFLIQNQIQQPFKQAFREIYLLTEAELNTRTYSNRMASHILKQHQYVSLAKGRNWKSKLIGAWDGGDQDTASLSLSEYNLKAEFWVNALNVDDQINFSGIWNYVSTDQIRFVNTITQDLVELIEIPPVVFSEVLRDVDLFVGVASVGNDPTWQDSGGLPTYRDYWQSYSFGDLTEIAKNRKEILQGLIPRLKIADVARIEDKFVVVKGKLRTYKIHIGSTNILMEPNDQYLCIVPDRSKKDETEKVFLPFEGDSGLSVIISKAFLLANDDKITDSSITSQINRN